MLFSIKYCTEIIIIGLLHAKKNDKIVSVHSSPILQKSCMNLKFLTCIFKY